GHGLRAEPAHFTQRQCDLRLGAERWMAASKDETQPVVAERLIVRILGHRRNVRLGARYLALENIGAKDSIAADAIDRFVAARPDQPRARIGRHACRRPLLDGGREGLLPRLFGQIEIAEQADQCCKNTTRLPAEDLLNYPIGHTGRTSILPFLAPGMRAAMAIASSRFFASIM